MLVLSRRESEKIVFPALDITLEIIRIKGNVVSVGIDAPKDIRVLRGELLEQGRTQRPANYSSKRDTEPAVRESRTSYQIRCKPIDLAAAAANDMIAC